MASIWKGRRFVSGPNAARGCETRNGSSNIRTRRKTTTAKNTWPQVIWSRREMGDTSRSSEGAHSAPDDWESAPWPIGGGTVFGLRRMDRGDSSMGWTCTHARRPACLRHLHRCLLRACHGRGGLLPKPQKPCSALTDAQRPRVHGFRRNLAGVAVPKRNDRQP